MDKRSVLAIVFTFIILLVWQVLYIGPKQKKMAEQRRITMLESARRDSLAALEERPAAPDTARTRARPAVIEREDGTSGLLPAEDALAESFDVTVETADMMIRLTNMGGEVGSVRLLHYPGVDGSPVQLVPPGARGGFGISLDEGGSRRSLSGRAFDVTIDGRPVSGDRRVILAGKRDSLEIVFSLDAGPSDRIVKRFVFYESGYEIGLSVEIGREGALRKTDSYTLSWECGLAVTEGDVRGDRRQFASMGLVGEEMYKESPGKFGDEQRKIHEGTLVWAGARTKYFLSALLPQSRSAGRLEMIGRKADGFIGYAATYSFRGDPRRVSNNFVCYLGPLDMNRLKAYGLGLERTIDLGRLRFMSVFVLNFMLFLKRFIPNIGVIIIILSILTKVLFYRLTHKSMKSMKDMQKLQPRIKELQEKHKDDKQKLNEETMKVYREAGVNPLGGCLPLVFQMPVFLALFNVLRNTIELRGAPFMLWINDLSQPDTLFSFGVKLPIFGSEFHLLPLMMGGAMILQTRLGGSPTGGAATPGAQTKMMQYMMPIVFTVFFYNVPSGLVLYWLVNNILSIVQQYYIHRGAQGEDEQAEPEKKGSGGK